MRNVYAWPGAVGIDASFASKMLRCDHGINHTPPLNERIDRTIEHVHADSS